MASENGLAGTVAKLLSLGANAALADEVRTCICVQTRYYRSSINPNTPNMHVCKYI